MSQLIKSVAVGSIRPDAQGVACQGFSPNGDRGSKCCKQLATNRWPIEYEDGRTLFFFGCDAHAEAMNAEHGRKCLAGVA